MKLLKRLFGIRGFSKEDLIRELAKQRIRTDPVANSMGYSPDMIDSLGTMELLSIPEATIVTIVETYALSLQNGVTELEILQHIENHRSLVSSGTLPQPLHLDSYIRYRLKVEHSHGAPINHEFVSDAIATCKRKYNV